MGRPPGQSFSGLANHAATFFCGEKPKREDEFLLKFLPEMLNGGPLDDTHPNVSDTILIENDTNISDILCQHLLLR